MSASVLGVSMQAMHYIYKPRSGDWHGSCYARLLYTDIKSFCLRFAFHFYMVRISKQRRSNMDHYREYDDMMPPATIADGLANLFFLLTLVGLIFWGIFTFLT